MSEQIMGKHDYARRVIGGGHVCGTCFDAGGPLCSEAHPIHTVPPREERPILTSAHIKEIVDATRCPKCGCGSAVNACGRDSNCDCHRVEEPTAAPEAQPRDAWSGAKKEAVEATFHGRTLADLYEAPASVEIPEEEMTENELDAELRSYGIDPEKMVQNAFNKVCHVLKEKSTEVLALRAENERLKDDIRCNHIPYGESVWKVAQERDEIMKRQQAEIAALNQKLAQLNSDADPIVTELYKRFKDWSKRQFSADDVTWCEVKANIVSLLTPKDAEIERLKLALDKQSELDALAHKIALEDVISVLEGECLNATEDGVEWMDMSHSEFQHDTDPAQRYLEMRELLIRHPSNPEWIRMKEVKR